MFICDEILLIHTLTSDEIAAEFGACVIGLPISDMF